MSLEALRKSLKDKAQALPALKEKVAAETATAEDKTALDSAVADMQKIADQIESLEAADRIAAKAAAPATEPAAPAPRIERRVKTVEDTGVFSAAVIGIAAAAVKAGKASSIGEVLTNSGYAGVVDDFLAAGGQKQLVASGNPGGILVPPSMATEIIEFLRPSTTFLQASPRRVPMPNGSYYQAGGNTGASAGYGAENAAAAYSEATFRDLNLSAKELKGKTAISNMLLDFGLPQIRQFVEVDLRGAMSETMDLNMFLGDGNASRPLGIYNVPGTGTAVAVNSTTPTVAQCDQDARKALNALSGANVPLGSVKWTMSHQTAGYLEDLRDGNGNVIYPSMQGENKRWKGFPVLVTTNLPTNLGGSSNESHISLVAYDHVFFGEAPGIEFKVSDVAAYTDAGGNMRSAAERNETVMFTFMRHDVGVRHLPAVYTLTAVKWGR